MVLAAVWENGLFFTPGGVLMCYNASKGTWQWLLPQAAPITGTKLYPLRLVDLGN